MRKKIIGLIAIILLLSGCGKSKTEQVKENHLNSCSHHNIEELLENVYDEVIWSEEDNLVIATGLVYDFEKAQETIYEFSLKGKNLIVNKVTKKVDDEKRVYEKDDYESLVNKLCEVSDIASKGSLKTKAKLKLLYNEEAYVVEGAPEEIEIIIYGDDAYTYLVDRNNDYEVFLYLRDFKASDKKQKVHIQTSFDSRKVVIKPVQKYAEILISDKVASAFSLEYKIINEDKLKDKTIKNVTLSYGDVVCRGSKKNLDKIATVKAIYDLADAPVLDRGRVSLESKYIQAFDKFGKEVQNVEIAPKTIGASIEIDDK